MAENTQPLQLTILTQERKLAELAVGSINVMTTEGEVTILPGHIPLFAKLAHGELLYRTTGHQTEGRFAISGGFMDVNPDGQVTILADFAIRSEDINIAEVEEAKRRAEEAMQNKKSEVEFRLAETELLRTLNELRIAQKRRGGSGGL